MNQYNEKAGKKILLGVLLMLVFLVAFPYIENLEPESILLNVILSILRFPLFWFWIPIIAIGLTLEGWEDLKKIN